jgi:hypothetical protein
MLSSNLCGFLPSGQNLYAFVDPLGDILRVSAVKKRDTC